MGLVKGYPLVLVSSLGCIEKNVKGIFFSHGV